MTLSFIRSVGLLLLMSVCVLAQPGGGPGRGPGRGMGRGMMGRGMQGGGGPQGDMRNDMQVFHHLLEHHDEIRRTVKELETGVETVTESDNPEIAGKIQEHVAAMQKRLEEGRGLRFWDPLFRALFQKSAEISMKVERTGKGVKVTETSKDPQVVPLIQAHARVVSGFVKRGFDEAHESHEVPGEQTAERKPADKKAEHDAHHEHAEHAGESGKKRASGPAADSKPQLAFPLIQKFGGVIVREKAAEAPRKGARVVLDVTTAAEADQLNKGLERVARLINLYGAAGLKADDVRIVVVVHGDATRSILGDEAYHGRFEVESNPNLPLLAELNKAGVEVFVCGQALGNKGFSDDEVSDGVTIAVSALTLLLNRQADGYTAIPVP
ncbi:MAG: DsrE family protein [Planctomycetaceae bacterium]